MQELLTVKQVAALLKCSMRMVWRLRDGGHLPTPVRLGRAVRWRAGDIAAWVEAGCPSCDPRRASGARGRRAAR
jgi:excisionase family DNA binding protein